MSDPQKILDQFKEVDADGSGDFSRAEIADDMANKWVASKFLTPGELMRQLEQAANLQRQFDAVSQMPEGPAKLFYQYLSNWVSNPETNVDEQLSASSVQQMMRECGMTPTSDAEAKALADGANYAQKFIGKAQEKKSKINADLEDNRRAIRTSIGEVEDQNTEAEERWRANGGVGQFKPLQAQIDPIRAEISRYGEVTEAPNLDDLSQALARATGAKPRAR